MGLSCDMCNISLRASDVDCDNEVYHLYATVRGHSLVCNECIQLLSDKAKHIFAINDYLESMKILQDLEHTFSKNMYTDLVDLVDDFVVSHDSFNVKSLNTRKYLYDLVNIRKMAKLAKKSRVSAEDAMYMLIVSGLIDRLNIEINNGYLTTQQVASICNCTSATVVNRASALKVPIVKKGRIRLFTLIDVKKINSYTNYYWNNLQQLRKN